MPLDVEVAGCQLFYAQGRGVARAALRVAMEPDLSPGDRPGPGSERRQVLPKSRWAPLLMYHKVPRVLGWVL